MKSLYALLIGVLVVMPIFCTERDNNKDLERFVNYKINVAESMLSIAKKYHKVKRLEIVQKVLETLIDAEILIKNNYFQGEQEYLIRIKAARELAARLVDASKSVQGVIA